MLVLVIKPISPTLINNQPYVPFVDINIKTFGEGFKPTDLLSDNEDKRLLSCSCVKKVMRLIIKNNNKQIVNNLDIYQTTGFLLFTVKNATITLVEDLF